MDARALQPTIAYWLAMYAASVLGADVGDYWSDALGLGLGVSFASLAPRHRGFDPLRPL